MKKKKFVLISDIHKGELIECRPGREVDGLLKEFFILTSDKPVIELGDRVNNTNHDLDLRNCRKIVCLFEKAGKEFYPVLGNHDLKNLSVEENIKELHIASSYYSKIINGIHFVFLNTSDPVIGECSGHVSKRQLDWFRTELQSNDLPKIICAHHPFYRQNLEGNPFFTQLPGQDKISNGDKVQKIIEDGKNIRCCLNGHLHWFYYNEISKIPCLSVPSFIENYPLTKNAAGHYCEMEIDNNGNTEFVFKTVRPPRISGRIEVSAGR